MRAHICGTGFVLGLAVTVFGSPAAWADSIVNGATNETVNISEGAYISQTGSSPASSGDPDAQVRRGAPEAGAGGQDAEGGPHLSVSLLALGMALGATAGAGAIVWREVRR